ncbi:MAG: MFS transporter [Candidatus Heimdallarchaeota archaeon]|nr:MFS transporter [Candidatus Heimdallarchaeota archaeon]
MVHYNSRNILLISFAAFIWSIYLSIQGQYLNDYIASSGSYTPLKISLMISLVALTGAIASIVFGAISDNLRIKFGRRKLFIIIGGVTSALMFFFLPLNDAIIYIIFLNVLMSLFNSAAFVCNNSFIPDIAGEEKLGKTNAYATLGTSLGTVVGFALMIIRSSSTLFFISGAICALGFLIVGIFIQEPKIKTEPKKWFIEIKETFQLRNMKNEKGFFSFLISHFLLHTGINVYLPFLLIFLTQKNDLQSGELIGLGLSLESGQVLVIFAVMTGISLLATIPIGFFIDKFPLSIFLLISRAFFAIATAFLAITPLIKSIQPLVVGILFIIPYSIANTSDIVSRGALMHNLAPIEKRGQFLGLIMFGKILAQIPGVLIGGLLAQFLQRGYQYSFIVGAAIILFSLPFISLSHISSSIKQSKIIENVLPS